MILILMLTVISLLFGTGQLYLTLIEGFPIRTVYWHSKTRKPVIWIVFSISISVLYYLHTTGESVTWAIAPMVIQFLMLVMTYRLHQETMFPAVYYPAISSDISSTPVTDDMEVALIEVNGDLRAYPLQYVIHHHVINDRFDDRIMSLTYCAMCRTIVVFDVTDIGPLYVASFKNANMLLGDVKTRTLFQQATFESMIGPLHPMTLQFHMSQTLPWAEAKKLKPPTKIVSVTKKDLREFKLPVPIPGIWKRIMSSERTPGLSSSSRDTVFPARTEVIGILNQGEKCHYLKSQIIEAKRVVNKNKDFVLIAIGNTVSAYYTNVDGNDLDLFHSDEKCIRDSISGTNWDYRGKYLNGSVINDLKRLPISDEYWFSWMRFHKDSTLIEV